MKYIYTILISSLILITSCQKDDYDLGRMPDKSEISYKVVQDRNIDPGGNTVILINETPETISMWDYQTGRSIRTVDTVRYAFQGEYIIKFSAVTGGGIVELDPITIEVTEDNLNYVSDPLWIALSGGPGNEKTWLLDLDADGVSKYFGGPVYFSSNLYDPDEECSGDCWLWEAGWEGNSWIGDAGDYGTMTFNLKGGPYVIVDHKFTTNRGIETGTYYLDVNSKTLTMTGAAPLQNSFAGNDVDDWNNFKIISLTENYMQLAAQHKSKAEFMIFNYISKEYSDNWVPVETTPELDEGYDPDFAPGELLNMITGGPSSGRVWKLDVDGNPVDWVAGGIGWTSSSGDSWDWGWNDSWVAAAQDSWILFDRFGGLNYTRSQNGTETSGTFTINEETNEIILDGNTLIQNPDSWMNPTTNTLKVVKAFPGEFESKGIWFGTGYDAGKDEWLVFHYVILEE